MRKIMRTTPDDNGRSVEAMTEIFAPDGYAQFLTSLKGRIQAAQLQRRCERGLMGRGIPDLVAGLGGSPRATPGTDIHGYFAGEHAPGGSHYPSTHSEREFAAWTSFILLRCPVADIKCNQAHSVGNGTARSLCPKDRVWSPS